MILERFEAPGLAHYSYLLGSNGQAVVIDPERNTDRYLKFADGKNLKITHVLETHIHADYASGASQLAAAAGAELWLSGHDEGEDYQYGFAHREMRDGDELVIGNLRIVAIHTPGHTPEHLSFLVYDKTRCGQPMSLFTGDFLFVGSLGRPDLLGEAAKQTLAHSLFESIHRKIEGLPDGVEIYPAHGAGSLCGSGMAQRPQSTLGYERFCNVFMADREEREFIDAVLGSVPEFPDYYRRMKRMNSEGPPLLDRVPGHTALQVEQFRNELLRLDAVVIDLRRPEAFGGAHIPNAFNIGAGQNLSMWAGWVVPYDRPILLVADEGADTASARRSLIRVGLDGIHGWLKGGMRAWIEAGYDQAHVPQISVRELDDERRRAKPFILDVRSPGEWMAGHIDGAIHIPGGDLPKRTGEIPHDRPVHVICGSGYRSSIAASVLKRAGVPRVINVVGGMSAWKAQALPEVAGKA
jgi:hydroxyacylglutathione hydrolase